MSGAVGVVAPGAAAAAPRVRTGAILTVAAIALVCVPTLIGLRLVFLNDENGSQSPIIILGVIFAAWQARALFTFDRRPGERAIGFAIFAIGCIAYVLGRIQSFYQLQALSWPLSGLGATLAAGGWPAVRRLAVPLFVLLLAIPIPGSIADDLLVPIKLMLSDLVVSVMYHLGLPVGNQGTVISVGYVQLRLADACAGLQSMISLTAICLLGNHLVPLRSRAATIAVTLLIVPIAFLTNFLRLSLLVLVAYFRGSAALATVHDYAAYIEVVLSLALLSLAHLAADTLFGGGSRGTAHAR